MRRLLVLLAAASAVAASSATAHYPHSVLAASATRLPTPPTPPQVPVWPPVFHAALVSEGEPRPQATSDDGDDPPAAGGAIVDLYYDWPRRRNANIVRHRLSNATLHDIEWGNKTSFYWTTEEGAGVKSCKTIEFPVGLLPPDWLQGADYRGRFSFDGVPCDLWTKASFVEYCARVGDGVPVQWRFTAEVRLMHMRVFRWEVGGKGGDEVWQAPGACFE